ncbi:MAG TPA: hypothetical protein VFF49_09270, partial [Thermodesulfobacteriota bacterium]|nr:hypothetical protein [Thermodesulfobacteriota bacterium]
MKFNNFLFTALLVLLTPLQATLVDSSLEEELHREGLPIINSIEEKDILPAGFRMTRVVPLPNEKALNLEGLGDLTLSGSAQFSESGLDAVIK